MNKKTDFKNFRLQSVLSRTANEIMTMHPVKKEWRIAIVALLIVKLLTMGFSLFGGWNYFNIMFYGLFDGLEFSGLNVPTLINVFAVITLVAIELLTAVFLQKMFKFFYRHRFITAVASALVVAMFYTVSFISSTNGLAERQARKADESTAINKDFSSENDKAQKDFEAETKRINTQIQRIEKNPQGWSEGKRSHLTAKQLADIAALQNELKQAKASHKETLKAIESDKNTVLQANTANTEKTAKDYYRIMAIIMSIQFVATGILIFFWHLIRSQESKDAVVSEDLKEISNTVAEHAENLIMNTLVNTSNRIHYAVTDRIQQNKYVDALPANKAGSKEMPASPEPETEPEKQVQVIGFGAHTNAQKNAHETHTKTPEPSKRFDNSNENKLKYLRKHTQLVKAILKTVPETHEHISNTEIKQIQGIARNARHKSHTLVRKVYDVVCTAGYDTVKKNIT